MSGEYTPPPIDLGNLPITKPAGLKKSVESVTTLPSSDMPNQGWRLEDIQDQLSEAKNEVQQSDDQMRFGQKISDDYDRGDHGIRVIPSSDQIAPITDLAAERAKRSNNTSSTQ